MKKLKDAWDALQTILDKKDAINEEYQEKLSNLSAVEQNIRQFIKESEDTIDKVDFDPRAPFESWKVCHDDIDRAVEAYRCIRDTVTANNSKAKAFEKESNEHKEIVANWLLQKANDQKVNSFRTDHGTAFKQIKVRASCANWDNFVAWAAEHGAADALFKRVNSSFVKQYQEENDGEIPPYLNVDREFEIIVRKS